MIQFEGIFIASSVYNRLLYSETWRKTYLVVENFVQGSCVMHKDRLVLILELEMHICLLVISLVYDNCNFL